jgi:hypothetical protein
MKESSFDIKIISPSGRGFEPVKIKGLISDSGVFGIHRFYTKEGYPPVNAWQITYIPTGLSVSVIDFPKRSTAINIVNQLEVIPINWLRESNKLTWDMIETIKEISHLTLNTNR